MKKTKRKASRNQIPHPHDRLVRALMSRPEVIREFLEMHLPEEVKALVDLSSIEAVKECYVDDQLTKQVVDLLYSVQFKKKPGHIFFLIEHASTPDKTLPLRMLEYQTAITREYFAKYQEFPLIYCFILYTGEKPYPHSLNPFQNRDLEKKIHLLTHFSPQLVDLTQVPDEVLQTSLWYGTFALLAKHVHDQDILPFLKKVAGSFRKLAAAGGISYIETSISYLTAAGNTSSEQILKTLTRLNFISEEELMTMLKQLQSEIYEVGKLEGLQLGKMKGLQLGKMEGLQEGMRKGELKGLQLGKREAAFAIAQNLLAQNISLATIVAATGLPLEEVRKLEEKQN